MPHRWRCSALAACGFAFAKEEPKTPAQVGRFVRITLPIDGQTFERTRRIVRRAMDQAKKEDARLVLIFEFDVPKGQKNSGRGSEFGAAHDLADFLSSEELNAVRTVAYVPQPIQGHAVLVALGLPGNRHGQRRLDRSGGHRREDDHAHACGAPTRRSPTGGGPCPRPWRWACSTRPSKSCRSRPRWATSSSRPRAWRN